MEDLVFSSEIGYPLDDGYLEDPKFITQHNYEYVSRFKEGRKFYNFFERVVKFLLENSEMVVKTTKSDIHKLLPKIQENIPSLSFFDDHTDYLYNPKRGINLFYCKRVADLLHEISHYIIATAKQRNMFNYGLGINTELLHNANIVPVEIDNIIFDLHIPEFIANILTIILFEYYGFNIIECINNSNLGDCFLDICYIDDVANSLQFLTILNIIEWKDNQPIITFKMNQC